MISRESIVELQTALKEEYGRTVTFQEASEMLYDLATYFDLLAKVNHRMVNGQ